MFGLFGKKEAAAPEERLASLQNKKDWAGLVKAYYELGTAAMEQGDLNHAQLWLHRADTIYGLFYNAALVEIEEKSGELLPKLRAWGLLSVARLVKLGERLSRLPGCEVLGELGWAVDMMAGCFQAPPSQEAYQHLMDICNALYELNGKPIYYTGEIEVPGKAPFQVFDLNGMFGVEQELNGYIDSHLRFVAALSQGAEELPNAESSIVACALLPDYYVRTGAEDLSQVPQIKAELQRIQSDFELVRDRFTWEETAKKIAEYKQLDILAK